MAHNPTKILIIDDSETHQAACAHYLRKTFGDMITIFLGNNGKEGLQLIRQEAPEVVITGYQLSDLSGLDLIERIQDDNSHHKPEIIMLTSQGNERMAAEAIKKGASDYILKADLSTDNLIRAVKNALDKHSLKKQLNMKQEEINHLSIYDDVTGLHNKTYFEGIVTKTIANAKLNHNHLAILLIDLDNFKNINDVYGHDFGDLLLAKVGQSFASIIRNADILARFGGDEFVVLLNNADDYNIAAEIATRLVNSLKTTFLLQESIVSVSASIGIAYFPFAGESFSELVKNADIALYKAKSLGKENFQFFTKEIHRQATRRIKIETALRQNLKKADFHMVYQPIFDLVTGRIDSLETLIRWKNKIVGIIGPEEFIPIAENSNAIITIGFWALEMAIAEFANIMNCTDIPIKLAINVSSRQLTTREFSEMITAVANKNKVNPNRIIIELTETAVIADLNKIKNRLKSLSGQGYSITIDDFGTGHSSLSLLKELPISSLKVDKTFTFEALNKTDAANIIKSVLALANNLSITNVVEGIETREQLNFIGDCGAQFGQGFYFAKPMRCEEIIAYIQEKESSHS